MDMLAAKDQWVNKIHPLVKLILTIAFLTVTMSFPKYDLTGSTELENDGTGAHAAAENIQEKTALLPDYGFKNSDSTLGTSFSGVAGSAAVLVVCVGACYAFRFFKKKKA